jgi:hypothetical protein
MLVQHYNSDNDSNAAHDRRQIRETKRLNKVMVKPAQAGIARRSRGRPW